MASWFWWQASLLFIVSTLPPSCCDQTYTILMCKVFITFTKHCTLKMSRKLTVKHRGMTLARSRGPQFTFHREQVLCISTRFQGAACTQNLVKIFFWPFNYLFNLFTYFLSVKNLSGSIVGFTSIKCTY